MSTNKARILYKSCPLCEAKDTSHVGSVSCENSPAYVEGLPKQLNWLMCGYCGHVFTDGYFTQKALDLLFKKSQASQTPGVELENSRLVSSRIIMAVCSVIGRQEGRWLDVGFGNGSLMTTAAEFGFEAVGLDLREPNVKLMKELSFEVYCLPLLEYKEFSSLDIISMADVLEHMPFPRTELEHAKKLLKPNGAIFISMPNMDSFVWKMLDRNRQNPYWGEIEHYHNFGRQQLYGLLIGLGFQPVYYNVSERYRAGMEVIAIKNA